MKNKINATGLFLLMLISLSSVAGNLDSAKRDSCCTTSTAKSSKTTTAMSTSNVPVTGHNTETNAAPDATEAIANLPQQTASADADINFNYIVGQFPTTRKSTVSETDALTDLQNQIEFVGKVISKLEPASVRNADSSMNASFRKAASLDVDAFRAENVSKMLIDSDKAIKQHFAIQYGTEVASSK
jgi:hypothetical protein